MVELESYVLCEIDFADTVAVNAESEFLLQPFVGLWLPCYVNIKPVITYLSVLYLNVCISFLFGYLVAYEGIFFPVVAEFLRPLKQVSNDVGIQVFTFRSSWKKSISELRNGECVQTLFVDFDSG